MTVFAETYVRMLFAELNILVSEIF